MDADAEQPGELPMEMIFREGSDRAQRLHAQAILKMLFDVMEHPLEPRVIVLRRRNVHIDLRLGPSRVTG